MSELASPISASADGKNNRYTFACGVIGQRRAYPVCLNLIDKKNDDRLGAIYSDCMTSIRRGTCPALKMQKEENAAGHAIYFRDRSVDIVIPEYTKRRTRISEVSVEPAVAPARSGGGDLLSRIGDMDYTKALNDDIAKTSAPAPVVAPKEKAETITIEKETAPKVEAVPGESLLEMARRLIAQKN